MVLLGLINSRMKDYFDVHALVREGRLDATQLARALAATFERRRTDLPSGVPSGLSDAFSADANRQTQWRAFLAKNRLTAPQLSEVVAGIREGIASAMEEAHGNAAGERP